MLISLDNEVPFVAVTRIAHTELISSAHTALQRAIAIDDALNTLILEGASLSAVLELLAERLNNPVILEDGARRVVDYGRSAESVTSLLRNWQTHSRQGHQRNESAAVLEVDGPPRCMWTTIIVKGEEWGRLHVIELDTPLDDAVRLALGRASASVALYLMAERDAALSDATEHSLVGALTRSEGFSGQDFLARAGRPRRRPRGRAADDRRRSARFPGRRRSRAGRRRTAPRPARGTLAGRRRLGRRPADGGRDLSTQAPTCRA